MPVATLLKEGPIDEEVREIRRDPEFWGTATWNGHCNHVHAAI